MPVMLANDALLVHAKAVVVCIAAKCNGGKVLLTRGSGGDADVQGIGIDFLSNFAFD